MTVAELIDMLSDAPGHLPVLTCDGIQLEGIEITPSGVYLAEDLDEDEDE